MQAMPPATWDGGLLPSTMQPKTAQVCRLSFHVFFEVKPLYKDLQTWCCLAFLCGLRWTCRPNGHMSKWCSRCVTVMFNVPWEWESGGLGGAVVYFFGLREMRGLGGGAIVYFFGLRDMSSNWKSTWGHTNTAISINIPAFWILEIKNAPLDHHVQCSHII